MIQPEAVPGQQGSKKCWACPTSIPYSSGFCAECWARIPLEIQVLYLSAVTLPEPYGGLVRAAIADGARFKSFTTKTPLTLGDLGL